MKCSCLVHNGVIALAVTVLLMGCTPTRCARHTRFLVASTKTAERLPSVASNPTTGDFLVAYLVDNSATLGPHRELRVQCFNATGHPKGGAISPFGPHRALGRPAIAYNPKSDQFLVAVPERVDQGGQIWDRVLSRHLDGAGLPLPGPGLLFDNKKFTYYDGPAGAGGHNSLHVVPNTLLGEFLVSCQWTVGGSNGVWAQRIQGPQGPYGPAIQLKNTGLNGFTSHGIAFAPVTGASPVGGRYLFVATGEASLLDAQINAIPVTAQDPNKPAAPSTPTISLNFGKPEGNHDQYDVACGEVQGKVRFLIVYSDQDNQKPGNPGSTQTWTGVWGTYIDPERLLYTDFVPGPGPNTPFPISNIWEHVSNKYLYHPRVAYSATAKAFFVVWREAPTSNPQNTVTLSHARGVGIDYYVPDGLYDLSSVPPPPPNLVLSTSSGAGLVVSPNVTYSLENPDYAAVTPLQGKAFATVWQQSNPTHVANLDIAADLITLP